MIDIEKLREICERATQADVIFQDEQPDGEMIQVSPGCYEGGIDGYIKTGSVQVVVDKNDPDAYPEEIGRFDRKEDADFYVESRSSLPALLSELEALRAIVKELASKKPEYADQRICVFCGMNTTHKADCLISRAKELIK